MVSVKKQLPPKKRKKTVTKTKKKGVLDRIAPIELREGLKVNLYGLSRTGKTTLACTFPKKLLLIGAEDGTKSVHNVKGVDFVRLESSQELRDVVEFLKEGKYKTGVLDTASSLQDLVLREILDLEELPAQLSWGLASRDQWGQCALKTKEMLRALLDLVDSHEMNIVICAQERSFNTDEGGDVIMPYVASAVSPSTVGWLNAACDYILETFIRQKTKEKKTTIKKKVMTRRVVVKGVEYCARTAPDAVYTTKFRAPKGLPLPDVIVDPSYAKIMKIIEGV